MVGNKAQKAVAAALTGMLALGSVAPALAGTAISGGMNWYRLDGTYTSNFTLAGSKYSVSGFEGIDGQDRYDTMLDIVLYNAESKIWKGTKGDGNVTDVVLVAGDNYADSLAASALAGYFGSPIITTPGAKLGAQAEKAIKYFAEKNSNKLDVWIVGGTAAVNDDVLDEVEDITDKLDGKKDVLTVKAHREAAGTDRTDTSMKVETLLAKLKADAKTNTGFTYTPDFYVANGWTWPDALSVSSFSYLKKAPIILTQSDGSLTAAQQAFLADKIGDGAKVHVIGGPAATAYSTLDALTTKKGQLDFISGEDRYDTNAEVIETFAADIKGPLAVATGKNWPDALVGGAFIGANNGALVLIGDDDYQAVETYVKKAKSGNLNSYDKYIIGGKSAVDENEQFWLTKWFK